MTADDQEHVDQGSITVWWNVSAIDGQRRVGWTFACDPPLDSTLAIALLRDVATDLEQNRPVA